MTGGIAVCGKSTLHSPMKKPLRNTASASLVTIMTGFSIGLLSVLDTVPRIFAVTGLPMCISPKHSGIEKNVMTASAIKYKGNIRISDSTICFHDNPPLRMLALRRDASRALGKGKRSAKGG